MVESSIIMGIMANQGVLAKDHLLQVFKAYVSRAAWEEFVDRQRIPRKRKSVSITLGHDQGYTFQARWVPCGKKGECGKCPHGPNVEAKRKVGERTVSVVLGNPYKDAPREKKSATRSQFLMGK
jgi:hypothetical protein